MTPAGLDELLQHSSLWRANAAPGDVRTLSTGFRRLDERLAGGGWPLGTLIELLLPAHGIGELNLWCRPCASSARTPNALQADDDLNWLYPTYIKTLSSFVCPSTQNTVSASNPGDVATPPPPLQPYILDLKTKARNANDRARDNFARGHSYEVFGAWHNPNNPTLGPYPRKTTKGPW